MLGRLVAIKVLNRQSNELLLFQEARALAAIRHPSIVTLLDWAR